jgi:hypothetical protein
MERWKNQIIPSVAPLVRLFEFYAIPVVSLEVPLQLRGGRDYYVWRVWKRGVSKFKLWYKVSTAIWTAPYITSTNLERPL